jgi:glyoxylase-like metal-dependent hydrolase (beta-lactamase superfamily II)
MAAMKISRLKTIVVNAEMRNWVFVKVETDVRGLYGWGEASLEWKTRSVVGAVEDFEPMIVGEEPTRIEHLYQKLYRQSFWRTGVIGLSAIWTGGETLDLGRGWRIEIHRTPGHSRGHLAIFDPRSGTMLTGDAVQGSVYLDKDGAPALCPTFLQVNSYLNTIDCLESLPVKLLASCHWPLKRQGEVRGFLEESREFVERTDELILARLACCPHGGSLRERQSAPYPELLIDGIGPELGSWPAAANLELVYALAGHLERLVCAGKITTLSGTLPLRYQVGK